MGFNVVMIDKDDNQMDKTKLEITALGVKVETFHLYNQCFSIVLSDIIYEV